MLDIQKFVNSLKNNGIEFISGVPDTLLNDLCLSLELNWPESHHVLSANEGNAIALATGYHLATNTVPLVYMQNSGLGNAMNPLISLTAKCVYSVPLVMLIGWRGEPGSSDWPQHQLQGEVSPTLLDSLGIKYKILTEDEEMSLEAIKWAVEEASQTNQPTALLVKKGVLAKKEKSGFSADQETYSMSREEAIKEIVKSAPENTTFVASTGRITRELYAIREDLGLCHNYDFLNVGAMGHTLSIAAGIAAADPKKSVICLDGDAAAIMHLGSMPITASLSLGNLTHIVLNNGVHESVGGQRSVGYNIDLIGIANASGYKTFGKFIETQIELNEVITSLAYSEKVSFIEVRIKKGMRDDMPILKVNTIKSKEEFMDNINSKKT